MKFGERVEFKVTGLDEKGRGYGLISTGQKTAEARRTIPGESVAGKFVGKDKRKLRLDDIEILTASPDRISEKCPEAVRCGGCSLQHIHYEKQRTLKQAWLNEIFEEAKLEIRPDTLVPAVAQFYHRNRMDYVFGAKGELGLKESGRWDLTIDLATCLMLSPEAVQVLERVREWAKSTTHEPWDNRTHRGYLRYVVIREGKFTNERMITLVTFEGELQNASVLIESLAPLCTTFYHGINPLVTDLSISKELKLLHGKPLLEEKISGMTYAIHPNVFFQTNSAMAEVLLEHVRELVCSGPHKKLLDLYCGVGFFSIALAKDVEESLGIELDPLAIESATRNAELNTLSNVRFRAEAAETLSWSIERPDVVIVDPPRTGLHPKVKQALRQHLPPRIVYVSCNPKTLATDLRELSLNYKIDSCRAFDLFPQTMHLETVVHLTKAS